MAERDMRNRRAYRSVAIGGLIVILAVFMWLVKPPGTLDLSFLSPLKPSVTGRTSKSLHFKQLPAQVDKLLTDHLLPSGGWTKTTAPNGYTTYSNRSRAMPYISVSPDYGLGSPATVVVSKTGARTVVAKPTPATSGTVVTIDDPRGVVRMR